jgi:hypothetical protein
MEVSGCFRKSLVAMENRYLSHWFLCMSDRVQIG